MAEDNERKEYGAGKKEDHECRRRDSIPAKKNKNKKKEVKTQVPRGKENRRNFSSQPGPTNR